MNILIADDELHARARLRSLIEEIGPPYRVVGEVITGIEVVSACDAQMIDLVLLDISMPGMDGLEAASHLAAQAAPPAVIFVTAYEEHALAAFEKSAVDYLLKPIRRERLEKALKKAQQLTRPQLKALEDLQQGESEEYISVSFRGGLERIPVADVIFFLAEQKYVTVRHGGGEALLEESLKSLEERLGDHFIRIHRNALVSRSRVTGVRRGEEGQSLVSLQGSDLLLEVSRRHLPEVRRLLKS
ncbi:MAG: LytTR family DNA-binding domain-containing protein [Candidatus Sedimenticola sp. (ex Thyasira tokunagai)]